MFTRQKNTFYLIVIIFIVIGIPLLSSAVIMGDINNDSNVNLSDLIISLKINAGFDIKNISLEADVNEDNKIGMEESVFILRKLSDLNYTIINKTNPIGYHVENKVTVNNTNTQLTRLVIVLPLAQSNNYQIVSNINVNGGDIIDVPDTDDKYVRFVMMTDNDLPGVGQTVELSYEFDVTLYNIFTDIDKITEIYPYNTNSDIYKWYTGDSGEYVNPTHPNIKSIGDMLWNQSNSIVDYARKCYEYVAQHYQYLNPYTGLHPLEEILTNGGGDCGNLSSIFVSLLRYKQIPSRHLVTIRPDGSYHVWADFYMEKYGWIPVDVTYKQSNPNGDYFGNVEIGSNGIIFTKDVNLQIDFTHNNTEYMLPILQNFAWWYWWMDYGNGLTAYHTLNTKILN